MIVSLYSCKAVPNEIPSFVDPHVTVDWEPSGKEYYIIEVNPNHSEVKAAQVRGQSVEHLLESYGIVKPKHYFTGEKPKF